MAHDIRFKGMEVIEVNPQGTAVRYVFTDKAPSDWFNINRDKNGDERFTPYGTHKYLRDYKKV